MKKKTKKRAPARKKARKAPARKRAISVRVSNVASDARKYGFKKKKPAKPKSKTIESLSRYIAKVDQWKKEQAAAAQNYRRLQALKAKVAKL